MLVVAQKLRFTIASDSFLKRGEGKNFRISSICSRWIILPHGKVISLSNTLSEWRRSEKQEIRCGVESTEICTTSSIPSFPIDFSSIFHAEKGYKWIERENGLLIFWFDAVLSQHFNPFVTILCSNKPFLCTTTKEGKEKRHGDGKAIVIFNLAIRIQSPVVVSCWGKETSSARMMR